MVDHGLLSSRFFIRNRDKLSALLPANSVAVIFSNLEYPRNGDQFFSYRQNSNLFYLSGINQAGSTLLMFGGKDASGSQDILFLNRKDEKQVLWTGPGLSKEEASVISGISNIEWHDRFDEVIREILSKNTIIFSEFTSNKQANALIRNPADIFGDFVLENFPSPGFQSITPFVENLRMVKEKEEIEVIRQAIGITSGAFLQVLKMIKPGTRECEIEALLNMEFTRNGAKHAYEPIVASGKSACTLHYTQNRGVCSDGDLLLMDFGAEVMNYASDCTRTIPVNGRFNPLQKDLYGLVLRVQKEIMKLYIPGNTLDLVNRRAGELMQEELLSAGLLSREEAAANDKAFRRYCIHGPAHFLGLDVHDPLDKNRPFEKGMVLTCEPGLYFPEKGIGIRIENDVLIDEEPIDLMAGIPREAEEIGNLMCI